LKNVLCAPSIQRNLISVPQFCDQNKTYVEFFPTFFVVKDLTTGAPLAQGPNKAQTYELAESSPPPPAYLASSANNSLFTLWHRHLGHPRLKFLKSIVSQFNLSVFNSYQDYCNSCLCYKSHHLPSKQSTLKISRPLELLFTDV